MFDFERPNIEVAEISEDKKYGRFVVEPLERGYGITLGNSLRRIMLSSLPGAAVSQVKIEGVLHEFSSIPGVKEDVTEIIMNIKSLAIKNNSETNEPKTAYIEFEGEGVVRASDIQADQDIEILNPDLVIATLSGGKESKLYMELTITKGRGYVSAEKNKSEDLPIGVIAVDSIYTPVERVNMTVDNTRVGQVTDFDKLTLDVYTNGTLAPDEAVSLAAKVLSEHLSLFIDLSENARTAEVMVEKEDDEKEKVLEMSIDELELSVRSYNCLKRAGINTVEELTNLRVNLRKAGGEFYVVKNTLARIAFTGGTHDVVKDKFHDNSAIALGFDDPVAVAKALSDFAKQSKLFQLRCGSLEGKEMSAEQVEALAKLPSKEQLLGQLLGTMNAVPTNFVSLFANVLRGLLYALKAIEEKKGEAA